MKMTIAERLRPFSHSPGTKCLLPKSSTIVELFPALIRIGKDSFPLEIEGPVKDFTATLDLEKGNICVCCQTKKGFLRYFIEKKKEGIHLFFDKIPGSTLLCGKESIKAKGSLLLMSPSEDFIETKERLSLGMHKAQDVDLIRRRLDLKEIFPLWLKLGSSLNDRSFDAKVGNFALLKQCEAGALSDFESLYLAAFEGILCPRAYDTQHQGICSGLEGNEQNPLPLLSGGAKMIRALFFKETEVIEILPKLPSQFHCGRFIGILSKAGDTFDIEWSKKKIRQLVITPASDGPLTVKVQKGISRCRIRASLREKGKTLHFNDGVFDLVLSKGKRYLLDRFEQ